MVKGRKYINKDGVNKVVAPEEIPKYLSEGWQLGNTNASHKGMTPWNKGLTKETSESVAAIAASKVGKERSAETKEKLSKSHIGKTLSEETKKKISEAHKGKEVSEETAKKISAARTGHVVTEETRQKIRESSLGRKHTTQAKAIISAAAKGRVMPEEQRKKLSELHKNPKFQEKLNNIKRKNGTFNTSEPEEVYYNSLVQIYGEEDVIRQYSDERYPYSCDFYIKSLDLFIELNLHWTHGDHPYNESDSRDVELKESLAEKAKTSEYYRNALYVWTDLDVRKQRIAKENNLNYKAVYSVA